MFDKRQHVKIASTVAVVVAVTLAFGVAGAVTGADTSNIISQYTQPNHEGPTVYCTDTTVSEGESTDVGVFLSEAPDGLVGYDFEASIPDTSTAEFQSVTVRTGTPLNADVSPDNTTATVEVVGAGVSSGATNINLVDIEVGGVSADTVGISFSIPSSGWVSNTGTFIPNTDGCEVTVE